MDHYNQIALLRRRWMRNDPRVGKCIYKHWEAITRHRPADDRVLSAPVYVRFFAVLHELLLPDLPKTFDQRRATAYKEWPKDAAGFPTMDYQQFLNALYQVGNRAWCFWFYDGAVCPNTAATVTHVLADHRRLDRPSGRGHVRSVY